MLNHNFTVLPIALEDDTSSESEEGLPTYHAQPQRGWGRIVGLLVVVACVTLGAMVAHPGSQMLHGDTTSTESLALLSGHCTMATDTAYFYTDESVDDYTDNVTSADGCCQNCRAANYPCRSWTWVRSLRRCYTMSSLPVFSRREMGHVSGISSMTPTPAPVPAPMPAPNPVPPARDLAPAPMPTLRPHQRLPAPVFPTSTTVTTTTTSAMALPMPAACPVWVGRDMCVTNDPSIHTGACYDPNDEHAVVQCVTPPLFDTYACPTSLPFKCAYVASTPAPSPSVSPVCYSSLETLAENEGGPVGTVTFTTIDACKAACTTTTGCNSFAACPQHGSCFLKDLVITAGVAQTVNADCRTFYKAACP